VSLSLRRSLDLTARKRDLILKSQELARPLAVPRCFTHFDGAAPTRIGEAVIAFIADRLNAVAAQPGAQPSSGP